MPDFQALLGRLNNTFAQPNIGQLSPDLFDGTLSLAQIAGALEIATNEDELAVISAIPPGMQEALRVFIRSDLLREERHAITFAWAPGYDYELTVWEAPPANPGPCAFTVLLRSRYP